MLLKSASPMIKLLPVASLVAAVIFSANSPAAAQPQTVNQAEMAKDLKILLQRTQALQNEVSSLKKQVKYLKKRQHVVHIEGSQPANHHHHPHHKHIQQHINRAIRKHEAIDHSVESHDHRGEHPPHAVEVVAVHHPDGTVTHSTALIVAKRHNERTNYVDYVPRHTARRTLTYIAGMPVVTSPYVGIRSAFDGSDLVVNISSINLDMRLLKQFQLLEHNMHERGLQPPTRSLLVISGEVEGEASATKPYIGKTTGDVDLADATIDFAAHIHPWATAFLGIDYDNSLATLSPRRINNSRIFVNKAFLTIGNFERSPFYFSAGQMFVPFGRYSSFMTSSPLTLAFRTKARAVVFGFKQRGEHGFFAQAFGFKGDSGIRNKGIGGVNAGYDFYQPNFDIVLGGSYISNIADGGGFQSTGGAPFMGFGSTPVTERIVRKVPGWGAHGSLTIKDWTVLGEYVSATRSFSPLDATFNGDGAKPAAFDIELGKHFNFGHYPATFAVGFGETSEALPFNLPQKRYSAAFNISLWRSTIESIEFRHDVNYGIGNVGMGRIGAPGVLGSVGPAAALGKSSNTVTADITAYF